jgi:hypothetical protein
MPKHNTDNAMNSIIPEESTMGFYFHKSRITEVQSVNFI